MATNDRSWFRSLTETVAGWMSSSNEDPSQTRDTLIPPETKVKDDKTMDNERKREQTKQKLNETIARLQKQESDLVSKHSSHEALVKKLIAAGRLEEAKTVHKKAHMYKAYIAKNRAHQCAATKRLLDLESMEVDDMLIHAFKDTSTYMREANKSAVKPDQVQNIMLDLTENQAEAEMVSEMIAATTDLDLDDGEEEFEAWVKESAAESKSEPQSQTKSKNKGKGEYVALEQKQGKKGSKKNRPSKERDQMQAIAQDMCM
jgi:hypothetical protein